MKEMVKGRDLNLRDEVRTFDGAYNTSTVINIGLIQVDLFRPYVHTSDVETTGGVTAYVGIEQYSIGMDCEIELIRRGDPTI